jgi:hypothetical protein
LHGVVFDIFDWQRPPGRNRRLSPQRSGFFKSEKRSGSSLIDGCSIGASTVAGAKASTQV